MSDHQTVNDRSRLFIVIVASLLAVAANAEPLLGSADAPVTIVEYGSLTCGYCVSFHRKVLPLIKSRHIDTGRVRFVYRDFPTSLEATRGAIAARCADDKYYTMLDALFLTVGSWSLARDVDTALMQQAASLGYGEETFRACLEDPEHAQVVADKQRQATEDYGVFGTPTFLINGRIVRGLQDIDQMEWLIDEALRLTRQQPTDAGGHE